jgi:cell division protein FtsA
LTTSVAHAERMKTLWGSAVSGGHDDRDMLVVPLLGEVGAEAMQRVSKGFLNNILRCRLEEMLELCAERLMQPAFAGSETARIVLTGGTSQLTGLAQLAQAKLERPARLGRVAALAGLSEHHRHGGLAAVVGSLVLAANPGRQHQIPKRAQARLQQSQLGYARKLTRWLAEAL